MGQCVKNSIEKQGYTKREKVHMFTARRKENSTQGFEKRNLIT